MNDFPKFMKNPLNAIAAQSQSKGIEGYVYDGIDGSQIAYWTCHEDGFSKEHVHDYDEYMIVVQGLYTLIINGEKIPVKSGEEYYVSKGIPHAGEFIAGTRTIHAFGGKRAKRVTDG
jgi:quercetin dioxygenase-like cupin family protein